MRAELSLKTRQPASSWASLAPISLRRIAARVLGVALATQIGVAVALPSDREQAINIESDRATREDKTGLSIYEGSVTITQGTIQIKADKVTIHHQGDKVNRIVCVGKPAHYQQQPKPEDGLLIANASTIDYHLDTDLINLIGNARVNQQGSTLEGERIDYDLKKERVEAHGDSTGRQRVRMVIPPNQRESKN